MDMNLFSFLKMLLSAYWVPGTVVRATNTTLNETRLLPLGNLQLHAQAGRQIIFPRVDEEGTSPLLDPGEPPACCPGKGYLCLTCI